MELGVWQPRLPHPQLHKTIIAKSAAMRKRKNVYMAIATDIPLSQLTCTIAVEIVATNYSIHKKEQESMTVTLKKRAARSPRL